MRRVVFLRAVFSAFGALLFLVLVTAKISGGTIFPCVPEPGKFCLDCSDSSIVGQDQSTQCTCGYLNCVTSVLQNDGGIEGHEECAAWLTVCEEDIPPTPTPTPEPTPEPTPTPVPCNPFASPGDPDYCPPEPPDPDDPCGCKDALKSNPKCHACVGCLYQQDYDILVEIAAILGYAGVEAMIDDLLDACGKLPPG